MASIEKFRPISDRILVQPDKPRKVSAGGIIIPGNVKQSKPTSGTVISKGPGMLMLNTGGRWPMPDVKRGDRIGYPEQAGLTVQFDEGEFLLLRDDNVLFIEEKEHVPSEAASQGQLHPQAVA